MIDDPCNLILNGDFRYGQQGWMVSSPTATQQLITLDTADMHNGSHGCLFIDCTSYSNPGSISISHRLLLDSNCTYQLDFDVKSNFAAHKCYLIDFDCYNVNQSTIPIYTLPLSGYSITTLAQDLNDGDTTIYVTDASSWNMSMSINRYLGIFASPAFQDNRALYQQLISAVDRVNNTITLSTAWAGGSWAAGTRVGITSVGSTYVYPWQSQTSYSDWTHISCTFSPRCGVKFSTLGFLIYTGCWMKLTNLSLINITKLQFPEYVSEQIVNTTGNYTDNRFPSLPVHFRSNGIINATQHDEFNSLPIRYIRDWAGQNTANANAHWCEIQALDNSGINQAFACPIVDGATGVGPFSYTSTGNINNSHFVKGHIITTKISELTPYISGSAANSPNYVTIDLTTIKEISQVKVWHYWSGGRTYHNTKTEVSADGINWITIFDSAVEGEYAESMDGHILNINKERLSIYRSGVINTNGLY